MKGIFDLETPADLLQKLEREFTRLSTGPDNADHAFDFFVTAHHMLDWLHPGMNGRPKAEREAIWKAEPILEITQHIANGAKHFSRLSEKHKSVESTELHGGYFGSNYWSPNYFADGYWGRPTLVIKLDARHQEVLGQQITAVELASKVLAFWRNRLAEQSEIC